VSSITRSIDLSESIDSTPTLRVDTFSRMTRRFGDTCVRIRVFFVCDYDHHITFCCCRFSLFLCVAVLFVPSGENVDVSIGCYRFFRFDF
jgi:hypothetical protein